MVKMKTKVIPKDELTNKICVVVGTRPSIVKMSPIIKELGRRNMSYFVIHAGQHYSYNMDKKFFKDLELPEPDYRIDCIKECKLHGEQTAEMLKGIEKVLIQEKPKVVLVCADANFNLAGALAARKLDLKLGHVEAGLRSNDWSMPEEHNRIMIDHISDYLFVPTEEARENAIKDNVKGEIILTGNTIVDAVSDHIKLAKKRKNILNKLKIKEKEYFLVTIHREENVDREENLQKAVEVLKKVSNFYNMKIVFPIHPRTLKMLKIFNLWKETKNIDNLEIIEPVGYLDFLFLLSKAYIVITDSGGVQEEACILKIPCITLRENTERPETIEIGANILAGMKPNKIIQAIEKMTCVERNWKNPLGNGNTAKRIIDIIIEDGLNGNYAINT